MAVFLDFKNSAEYSYKFNRSSQVSSRDELLEVVWGKDYLGDNRTVDVHIRKIREKIVEDDANPKIILTKWGVGYYFKDN